MANKEMFCNSSYNNGEFTLHPYNDDVFINFNYLTALCNEKGGNYTRHD